MGRLKTARASVGGRGVVTAGLSTDRRLVAAATALLDEGGEAAVTLRAVAQASNVSHNAPYKHFESRDALLAAVAVADFELHQRAIRKLRASGERPYDTLMKTLRHMLQFAKKHPARYRLLFGNRQIATAGGEVKRVATLLFAEVVELVRECQRGNVLPEAPSETLANLLFATLHGLISIEAAGGIHPEKGFNGVEQSLQAWLALVAPR